ncbi:radical SAM protein [[Clostridium] sordellii]|uniref:elongator complex protein 3 n=1 Tax=Paraclostridium sordellii TaxID=1505 RepID=UPI0005DE0BC9|nr:radical SAM protein [Paeniclostridium sordellii]MDU1454774.1 radical SAM protein [Paeniclostridium sordellii]MDU2148015.1 radical SAM protein [Paeniclostridium sordellii]MVO69833.1 radical SAM protein [Paeniclostridium sordellii]CEN76587.1 radical SAM protein [[Clostridium] sordellii] [Paeniclostridium sordellii]CEO10147.1 radical SAM protein [[Clostridium] sordellii] [Paeniclostridium sordellii]
MKKRIIPIFVPHRGCPHDCIFCNQKKITGVSTDITSDDVRNIIEEYLKTIDKDASVEVAFFGGSFTAIDIDIQRNLLSVAKEYVDKNIIDDIRMSTRPDCINDEILTMLKEYKVSIIELGVQSLDDKVLIDSVRGHSDKDVFESAELIKKYGINLGLQMMIGLPSDTEEKCIYTAKKFIDLKPDCVRVYPTLVVKETGLEKLLQENKYNPFSLEESIDIVKKVLVLFYINNVNVIRVGLQATEDIAIGKEVLAGPYHPAYRELVESKMYGDYIEYLIKKYNAKKNIDVLVNKKNVSRILGNKKSNVKNLKEKYGVLLKTKESEISINELAFIIDDKETLKINIYEIYNVLKDIYNL